MHVCKQSSRVVSRLESFIVLPTGEKSCTKLSVVYSKKNRQVEKSSLSINGSTVSCRQWMYNCVYVVHCLRAEMRILSCTVIHLCRVFTRIPVPTKFCFQK